MEKPICVVFDFTTDYWGRRLRPITANYEIVKNIFCVAASRGKEKIIFLEPDEDETTLLNEEFIKESKNFAKLNTDLSWMSDMFDHKYDIDLQDMLKMLDVKKIKTEDTTEIKAQTHDDLIDLTPCIGKFLEASYFDGWDIEKEISFFINYIEQRHKNQPAKVKKVKTGLWRLY